MVQLFMERSTQQFSAEESSSTFVTLLVTNQLNRVKPLKHLVAHNVAP